MTTVTSLLPLRTAARPRIRSHELGIDVARLVRLYLLALALQAAVVLVTSAFGVTEPFFSDAVRQHERAQTVADMWVDGPPSPGAIEEVAGTQAWGPEFLFGSTYHFLGKNWIWAKLMLAVGAAAGPVALYVLAHGVTADRRVHRAVFWIAAAWPTTAFWSATGIKDGFVTGLALAALAAVFLSRGMTRAVTGVSGAGLLFFFRPVVAGGIIAAMVASETLRRAASRTRSAPASRRLLVIAAVGVLGVVVLLPRFERLVAEADTLTVELNGEQVAVFEGGIPHRLATAAHPANLAHGMLGPVPWLWDAESASPYRWLFPASAVWILGLPFVALGAGQQLRRRHDAVLLLLVFAAVYLAVYYVAFVGEFARQRSVIEPVGILLAVTAWYENRARATTLAATWVSLVSGVALASLVVFAL